MVSTPFLLCNSVACFTKYIWSSVSDKNKITYLEFTLTTLVSLAFYLSKGVHQPVKSKQIVSEISLHHMEVCTRWVAYWEIQGNRETLEIPLQKKEKACGKGRQLHIVEFMLLSSHRSQGVMDVFWMNNDFGVLAQNLWKIWNATKRPLLFYEICRLAMLTAKKIPQRRSYCRPSNFCLDI